MGQLTILVVYYGLMTVSVIGGQMNSDPAPGRSPGPPGISPIYDQHGGDNDSPTLLLIKDPDESPVQTQDRDDKKINALPLGKDTGGGAKRAQGQDGGSDAKLKANNATVGKSRRNGAMNPNCGNELSDYLRAKDEIVDIVLNSTLGHNETADSRRRVGKDKTTAAGVDETFGQADIQLEIMHDLFEAKDDITCGLMYRVRISLPESLHVVDFFLESLSGDRRRGTFVRHLMSNKLPLAWFKSSFVSGTDWATENFRKQIPWTDGGRNVASKDNIHRVGSGVAFEEDIDASSGEDHNDDGSDEDDDDDDGGINSDENGEYGRKRGSSDGDDDEDGNVVPSHGTWEAIRSEIMRKQASRFRGGKSGSRKHYCSDNTWRERVVANQKTEWTAFWMIDEFCDNVNDTVNFRLSFRIRANGSSEADDSKGPVDAKGIVYRKSFLFNIIKDCHLFLKQSLSTGVLDYASLPLYNVDCTVHFPSLDKGVDDGKSPESRTTSYREVPNRHPGLLVQLTRLNVPCDSGGYIKLSANQALCGKLEELLPHERTYYFNTHKDTSVRIYKGPMFNLKFRLVDYCYNMSLTEQNGSFFLHPAEEPLECYFRIHLPYGNRIELSLVVNNESTSQAGAHGSSDTRDSIFRINSTSTSSSSQGQSSIVVLNDSVTHTDISLGANGKNASRNASSSDFLTGSSNKFADPNENVLAHCEGLRIQIQEFPTYKWSYCASEVSGSRKFSLISQGNTLVLHVVKTLTSDENVARKDGSWEAGRDEKHSVDKTKDNGRNGILPSLYLAYSAKPVATIVSDCAFGWVAMQQFCVSTVNVLLTWHQSEEYCTQKGGHLASIRSEAEQKTIDQLLLNSPGYQDRFAYWIGATDKTYEGDFRWNDGLPFSYTNWFPGWSQHGHYNKQPNDDGLSGQDCIELRRDFRVPPGVQATRTPNVETFMWNDRDCNARNYFICERPIVDEPVERNWSKDCNKTMSLTKERPRASLWSPSFPRQYPDNANCYSTVTAPSGYRIVLEFEELVLENEPACSYDYLEITEPTLTHHVANSIRTSDPSSSLSSSSSASNSPASRSSRHGSRHAPLFRKRNSYESNLSVNSNSNSNSENDVNNINLGISSSSSLHGASVNSASVEITQANYQNLLGIFSNMYKPRSNFLIQTPDHPGGNPFYHTTRVRDTLPRRMCGDWSSKLKLLRYVSAGSYLGLHFVSDYSHHYGGYKAKVFMENTASECPDERLKPYNGSCYLFVSYPEVDWWTAQQVCRGIGAQLSSVSSADEHRFITSSIRNQADYSPQLIYWLGGELANNRQFEWADDTKMRFQGWLPGQGQFDMMPTEAMCLGLQWKMSPTPMLPSGLYWEAQRCRRVGGYICKKPKQSFDHYHVRNETVTGLEGRLTSPGYPNPYPLNMEYWVRIAVPERHRIIVQFQKIDLEPQDECLYDYVSVQNYEPLELEPVANPLALTMLKPALIDGAAYKEEASKIENVRRNRNAANPFKKLNDELLRGAHLSIKPRQRRSSEGHLNWQPKGQLSSLWRGMETSPVGSRFSRIPMNRKRRRKKRALNENPLKEAKANAMGIEHVEQSNDDRLKRSSVTPAVTDAATNNAQSFLPYVRWCGTHDTNMSKFDFISASNEIILNVHSDYSISGLGFAATWKAIDISGCPLQTLTAREGSLVSPNYPHFLLNNLECTYIIQAPMGRKVWLEFTDFRIIGGASIELDVGRGYFQPFRRTAHLNEGTFVSLGEQIRIQIRTGMSPRGYGFQAFYKTVGPSNVERVIHLNSNTTGLIYHLNYPQVIPGNVEYTEHLMAPLGEVILLELYGVEFSQNGCQDHTVLEEPTAVSADDSPSPASASAKRRQGHLDQHHAPVYITSYLNTLHVRQKTTTKESFVGLNATVRVQSDVNYKLKLASGDDLVESCEPNPCQSNGKCMAGNSGKKRCQCHGHFTGRFCGLTMCELEPCLFGKCELTPTGFKCHCQTGYIGATCEQKQKPCADNPCEGRGECFEKNGGYFCRCHAWWEGARCEKRMMHIPYKPLSERMLQEPFWLGLITVFVVLAVIGLVWCAKRHFPEKIEKLLAEEADRNRPFGHGHHHHTSLREQLQFTTSIPQAAATTPGAPRSIFNRLGIRKPSILSLSSPNPPGGATARTFSLDDLLRPPPRRSPSPRKKRNNSTPTKKNAAEKKQILQQLVSPAAHQLKPKVSLGELIQMSENRLKATVADSESDLKETTFSENSMSASASTSTTRPLNDPKLEKKVTFARLLSKVSAEMSSGSEMDGVHGTHNSSALSLPTEIQYRANSLPQSPCTNDIRSPHSTSSNQGSDSLSSSDLALTDIGLRNLYTRRIRPKVTSADSILAMLRNFPSTTSTNSIVPPSSVFVSPSTTPTVSSPQDDIPADDESSTSSMHTPVSFSSGAPDSPVFYRQTTIEVPVLDVLNAHKSNSNANVLHPPTILLEIPNNGINKCLSPIRELPTPMPSPALTPIMPRPQRTNSPIGQADPLMANYSDDEDQLMSNRLIPIIHVDKTRLNMDVSTAPTDTPTTSTADINRKQHYINSPISITIGVDPPTPEERTPRPRNLIIPTLIVEQPSPTRDIRERLPPVIQLGSPPPQRASIGETSFAFPSKEQQKRLLKQFEKPTSLDLPFVPPMITVTSNVSELESDVEPMSPAPSKLLGGTTLLVPGNPAMCYLSPFPMCTRADRTISESNLSSSGYSSMASPGPSRCGSSNPLCPNEMDESGGGPTGAGLSLHMSLMSRRQNSLLASCKENITNGKSSNNSAGAHERLRGRSDSETLSDDALLESNDEGIGTDHLDEKPEDIEMKRTKDLEVYISEDLLEVGSIMLNPEESQTPTMAQLQLPSIVIQGDGTDKLSPVSSRSESPLSERAGMGRFSPHFYGRKDQLPFTDSDGLYDFPSSDGKGAASVTHQRRSSSKKRDRKSAKNGQNNSPTRNHHLDLPSKDMVSSTGSHNCSKHFQHHHHAHYVNSLTARKSPKRRPVQKHPVASSSSSTESLTSARELTLKAAKVCSPSRDKYLRRCAEASEDDTGEDVSSQILPSIHAEELIKPRKISRLRAIGNQIRFLRRLEKSIKRRERVSPSDSCPEDGNEDLDSPRITSPLLQSFGSKPKISICRQKRLPTSIYTSGDRGWRSRDRSPIHGDINSD